MNTDCLSSRKTVIENRIESLGSWMIGFTWPVAIGLLIEFYAVLDPKWSHSLNIVIDRIGLLSVTAGVVGELAVEHKAHRAGRQLREIDIEIEREAESQLKLADERIAELNLLAEKERNERLKLQLELQRTINAAEQRAVHTAVKTSVQVQEELKKRRPQRQ